MPAGVYKHHPHQDFPKGESMCRTCAVCKEPMPVGLHESRIFRDGLLETKYHRMTTTMPVGKYHVCMKCFMLYGNRALEKNKKGLPVRKRK